MDHKINVVVAERSYTLTTSDKKEYVEKVAEFVDDQMDRLSEAAHASTLDAAIMTALNIADSYFKEQLTQYLDEANRLTTELSEAKRELFRLQQGKN